MTGVQTCALPICKRRLRSFTAVGKYGTGRRISVYLGRPMIFFQRFMKDTNVERGEQGRDDNGQEGK